MFGIGRNPPTFEFRCAECGELHRGSPSFSHKLPEHVFDVPEDERVLRVTSTDDICIIRPSADDRDERTTFWIRTILELPIHGVPEPFTWGLWVSQSEEAFERYVDTFDDDQSDDGSFGWLPVHMAAYRNPDGSWPMLKCDVSWGPIGKRPELRLWECDNQLYIDQRDGISWERAIEIATPLMH